MVSIIVPVYNVEIYLRKCLDSIVNQTFRDLEILVIDDGSSDQSGKICDEYAKKDKRIRVFHTENRGLSAARNYGIDHAQGDYIGFIDSDDWFEETAIQKFVDTAMATGSDIVACRFYREYVNKTIESSGAKEQFTVEGEEILRTMILERKFSEDVWNKFYRATLFESIRYPEGRIFEDYATTYQLLRKSSRLTYIPDCLIHYRNRKNSLSNIHTMKSLTDYWWVYHQRFETLGSISKDYYRVMLSDCVRAAGRMWRWYAGCSGEEQRQAKVWLDEIQGFMKEHSKDIKKDSFYSRHTKWTCWYTKSKSPVLLFLLFHLTNLYKRSNRLVYFEESNRRTP